LQGRCDQIRTDSRFGEPRQLGKYELVEKIGEGGFGAVFAGFDPFIKRRVAIKICTSPDVELRQRYFREAEIAGRLDHPNIVRIFDFGVEDDRPYLVQEFLPGEDLDVRIERRGFLPHPERLLYLIHIARGLEYAHRQGVTHRDIKPANIRILDDGTAKIMDFGVATLEHQETRLTRDGMTVGTAAYLAPEQIRGQPTDPRTDIFSFGVLAYELLTGERPFYQENISATLFSVLNDDPKPITLPARLCPESLRQLVLHCLEKDPDRRCPGFGEILSGLDRVRREMRTRQGDREISHELRRVIPSSRPDEVEVGGGSGPRRKTPPTRSPPRFDPPLRHEWTPSAVRTRRRRRRLAVTLPAGLLLLAATAYGVLVNQGLAPWPRVGSGVEISREDPRPEAQSERAAPSERLSSSTSAARPIAESAVLPADKPASAVPQDAGTPNPDGNVAQAGEGEDPAREAAAAVEPALPAAQPATLRLARGWHGAILVSVDGGEPSRLSSTRSLTLEPGAHRLTYSLSTPDYRAMETIRVELGSGEDRTVRNPIAPPGRLTVQARLGSPQGLVGVDGKILGTSPLRGYSLSPGRHQLQVFDLASPTRSLADTRVDVRSSRETLVTFDLTGQRELAVHVRDLQK
jgi:serine/threonine protein kinase